MSFWKFCFRVLGFFVCLTEIYQKWKRYITTPERQNFIFRSLVMLLKTKIYLHYQIHLGIYGIYYMMMKLTVMRVFEHTVPLFFNDVSKILIANQMIWYHKAIYNLFGSGIYHKPHYIFKSKLYEFNSNNIGLFSGNDTTMAVYFVGMHRYLRMKKYLFPKFNQLNSYVRLSILSFTKL